MYLTSLPHNKLSLGTACPAEGVISLQKLKLLELRWSLHCVYMYTFSSLPFRLPSSSSILVLISQTCYFSLLPLTLLSTVTGVSVTSAVTLEWALTGGGLWEPVRVSALPSATHCLLFPVFNTILCPNAFCIQSRWFREEYTWDYLVYSTELQMSAILTVPFTQLIQLGMLGTTLLGFHCFCFESFFLRHLLVLNGWKSNQ